MVNVFLKPVGLLQEASFRFLATRIVYHLPLCFCLPIIGKAIPLRLMIKEWVHQHAAL